MNSHIPTSSNLVYLSSTIPIITTHHFPPNTQNNRTKNLSPTIPPNQNIAPPFPTIFESLNTKRHQSSGATTSKATSPSHRPPHTHIYIYTYIRKPRHRDETESWSTSAESSIRPYVNQASNLVTLPLNHHRSHQSGLELGPGRR